VPADSVDFTTPAPVELVEPAPDSVRGAMTEPESQQDL